MTNDELNERLAEYEGYDDVESMLEAAVTDSVCPGICTQCCNYTTEVEPDSDSGYCEECNSNTVKSCLILADII